MTEGPSKVEFSGLVGGLATSAIAVLSQVEVLLDPSAATASDELKGELESLSTAEIRKRISDGLAGARQLIDTLGVLEKKTEGNLTDEERQLLQAALSDLRIRFVNLKNRPLPEEKAGEGNGGG